MIILALLISQMDPTPGTVPLVVESDGGKQKVGLVLQQSFGAVSTGYGTAYVGMTTTKSICTTPCTLYVQPGLNSISTGGNSGIVLAIHEVDVPANGLRLKARAPSAGARFGGFTLVSVGSASIVGGATLLAIGLAIGPSLSSRSTMFDAFPIAGGVMMGIGAAALIPGIILLALNRPGIAEESPIDAQASRPKKPKWTAAIAPSPHGLSFAGAVQF